MTTDEMEANVLAAFAKLEEKDPKGAWASYYAEIAQAAGGFEFADPVCRELRRKKLLKGEGRGMHATYYLTEKGKAAAS